MLPNRIAVLFIFIMLNFSSAFAQPLRADKIEPPNWWTDMKFNRIQLMVYGSDLNDVKAEFSSGDLKVLKVSNAENHAYTFIDVEIPAKARPGNYKLTLSKGKNRTVLSFPLYKRSRTENRFKGFSQKDVIYMITPDRFANGDISNDSISGMNDHFPRTSNLGRHGGDIQGIIDHLDYLKDLGVTALWINPLVENNTRLSYHGYAATDLYKIDPRFGTNSLYTKFVEEAHKRGMKVILDHVNNHVGIYHPWIKNPPFAGWINGTAEKHNNTIHYNSSNYDIHADSSTRIINNQGWFVNEMPDLNQRNPFLAGYLIQNTIWWIESTGLDGIREDTYPYSDQQFLSRWAKEIMGVYPEFNIVGEVWMGDPAFLAPYQAGSPLHKNFDTHLPSVTDFAFNDIVREALRDSAADMRKIYDLISKDYLYPDPSRLVIFADNHDISRIIYELKGDFSRFKLAMTLLLTCRGIPQLYYGTELGIEGGPDHGSIRADFPGGFSGSNHNAFLKEERTQRENQYYDFIRSLIAMRKKYSPAIGSGTMIHFPVYNNMYFYLRDTGSQSILVILNGRNEKQKFDFSWTGKKPGRIADAFTGNEIKLNQDLSVEIPAMGAAVFELK